MNDEYAMEEKNKKNENVKCFIEIEEKPMTEQVNLPENRHELRLDNSLTDYGSDSVNNYNSESDNSNSNLVLRDLNSDSEDGTVRLPRTTISGRQIKRPQRLNL